MVDQTGQMAHLDLSLLVLEGRFGDNFASGPVSAGVPYFIHAGESSLKHLRQPPRFGTTRKTAGRQR